MKTFRLALMTSLLVASLALASAPKKLTPAKPVAAEKHDDCEGEAKKEDSAVCHHPEQSAQKTPTDNGDVVVRGDKLKGAPSVALADLLKDPAAQDGKTVVLEGTVRRACERKGCWMELAPTADSKGPGVRVTFKDYGFFVPLDSAGRKAKVEGTVKVATLSDERAKHYESEGATVPRGADGMAREVQLVASGVELRK